MEYPANTKVVFGLLAAVCPSMTWAEDARCDDPDVVIELNTGHRAHFASGFGAEMVEAIEAVCRWWGPDYSGTFTIYVEDYSGPSMALVPAWRGGKGHMLFSGAMVARGRAATIHEVTHVIAPNGNRFLAEGLAVYAHEHLGGPSAYPSFGHDLHTAARRLAHNADLSELDGLATPSRLRVRGLDERDAYIVAGSFVRFLITQYGLDRFRGLYALTPLIPGDRKGGEADRWKPIYGLSLTELEAEWKNVLLR